MYVAKIITVDDIQNDVDKAADILDSLSPGWTSFLVNTYGSGLADMNVSDPDECPLAALYGGYTDGDAAVDQYMSENGIEGFDNDPFACLTREDYIWREAWRNA